MALSMAMSGAISGEGGDGGWAKLGGGRWKSVKTVGSGLGLGGIVKERSERREWKSYEIRGLGRSG